MKRFFPAYFVLLGAFAGCASPGSSSTLIPDKSIQLTSKTSVSLATLVNGSIVAAAVNYVYDPLAPNWEITEARLADDMYYFSLKMKRFHTGGAGESMQVLKRRVAQLQSEQGFAAHQLLEYSEGVESITLGAQRVAHGKVKLVQRQSADSFQLNEQY